MAAGFNGGAGRGSTPSACIFLPRILIGTRMKRLIATRAGSDGSSCRHAAQTLLSCQACSAAQGAADGASRFAHAVQFPYIEAS